MQEMSDNSKTGEGDSRYREFTRLVITNQTRITAFILSMVPQRQDAEDILQDTLVEMWNQFGKFEQGSSFLAWGCTIAKYKTLNHLRRKKNSRLSFSDELLEIIQNESIERMSVMEQRADNLKRCVKKLPARDAKLLRLRYEDDLTFRKIAELYGHSHQAVCKAMSRIHSQLVSCINKEEALA